MDLPVFPPSASEVRRILAGLGPFGKSWIIVQCAHHGVYKRLKLHCFLKFCVPSFLNDAMAPWIRRIR